MEKRYYWIKLSEGFFGDKAIKKLRSIAGGDTYTIIYLKMLLLAIKQDNKLYYDGIEVSFSDEVALEIGEDPENVKLTMSYLKSKGLIEEISADEILLTQCGEMVGSETDAARRQRVSRQRRRNAKTIESNVVEMIEEIPAEEQKPKKETCIALYERIASDYIEDNNLWLKIHEWIEYKVEKKDSYKERGMRALLKNVCGKADVYGCDAVCNLIDECMSSNWKGIIWDRLEKGQRPRSSYVDKIQNRVSDVDNW